MKVIIDVNIILSALIRDSTTRKIIVNSDLDLYFPESSLHKIRKYQDYIIEKSGLDEEEYYQVLEKLFGYIKLISKEELIRYWEDAKTIMENIDPEDTIFIASALSLENSIIWSDDSHFDRQNKVRVLKTKDMLKLFFG